MDVLDDDDDDGQGSRVDVRRSLAVRNQEVRLLSAQILHLRRELIDARSDCDCQIAILKRQLARMSNNICRLSNRPVHPMRRLDSVVGGGQTQQQLNTSRVQQREVFRQREQGEQQQDTFESVPTVEEIHAVGMEHPVLGYLAGIDSMEVVEDEQVSHMVLEPRLTRCPRSLHDLWKEYAFGFSGFKPAKDWTSRERGADRFNYYRRNVFWMQVVMMVRSGYSAERACDKIYSVYGPGLSVTKIIKAMIRDKKNGGHPALRDVVA